ncbi:MAG: glycosyltransferase family 2 protein [Spirochaetota bacterium]|nr:glycosyltransferase family 2 protein [Spirochaetota bacterium]
MKYSLIIPAYNEEKTLPEIINNFIKDSDFNSFELIFINDGSTDKTREILEDFQKEKNNLKVKIINHPYNKGYGAAIKTGVRSANTDIIVLMDADGQHSVDDVLTIVERMNEFDMVIGDRGGKASPKRRNLGKWVLQRTAEFLVEKKIPDLNSGFRAFRKSKFLEFLHLYPNTFSITSTMTLAFIKAAYNIDFIPIDIKKRSEGESQVKIRDGAKTMLLLLRIIMMFNPLKVFAPVGLALLLLGLIYSIVGIALYMSFPKAGIFVSLSGLNIFFFGLIADQLSQIRKLSD